LRWLPLPAVVDNDHSAQPLASNILPFEDSSLPVHTLYAPRPRMLLWWRTRGDACRPAPGRQSRNIRRRSNDHDTHYGGWHR
jgi:hypothetical protein